MSEESKSSCKSLREIQGLTRESYLRSRGKHELLYCVMKEKGREERKR